MHDNVHPPVQCFPCVPHTDKWTCVLHQGVFLTDGCHVHVLLPGYFQDNILVHLAVETQKLSGGRVEDLGWILIIDQVLTPSLFLVPQLGLPPEDHPVTLGSQGGAFHAQRWHQKEVCHV